MTTTIPDTAAFARLKVVSGLAGELRDRVAAEAEQILMVSAAALLPAYGLDRLLIGLSTIEHGNGAPSEFLQILGYRTTTGEVVAVSGTCPEINLPAGTRPLTDLLGAYAEVADGVVDEDCAWRLLLTADGAVCLQWDWHDLVEHGLDLRDPVPLSEATYYAMLGGVLPAGVDASMTVAGRDVRVYSGGGATSLSVTVAVGAGTQRLTTLDEFHARVAALAERHGLAVAYAPGRRLDVLAAALCTTIDTTAFADRVSELTEHAPAVAATVPVELLRRAQRALAGDLPVDLLREAFGDVVDELLGGAEAEQARVITVRLAAPATRVVRDALTGLGAMAAGDDGPVEVRVGDDGIGVRVTVPACPLGVAQHVAREFVRFCVALHLDVDVAEVVSIEPAP